MGMCVSCQSGAVAVLPPPPSSSVMVILFDGDLCEFVQPVKAAYVLEKYGPAWIVCDADGMDFNGVVTAVADNDELRSGQLYFVLPAAMLQQRLRAEEIAALAVKASAALARAAPAGKSRFRRRAVAPQPLVFAEPAVAVRRPKSRVGKGWVRILSVIQE